MDNQNNAQRVEVRCEGCGSDMTDEDLELKRRDPKVLSCCPERNPLDITGWMAKAVAAEAKLTLRTVPQPASAASRADLAEVLQNVRNGIKAVQDWEIGWNVPHVLHKAAQALTHMVEDAPAAPPRPDREGK